MPQASNVLSHIEVVYRPGERDLAIALFEAMGCKTYETDTKNPAGVSYISAHPDPDVRGQDDVFYISEMPPVQAALEGLLRQRIETDDELRAARDNYRAMADTQPFGLSHVALRYPTFESLEAVLAGLEAKLTPELKSRVILKVFRPGDSDDIKWGETIQAFIYTDIAVAGGSMFGQVYELASYRY